MSITVTVTVAKVYIPAIFFLFFFWIPHFVFEYIFFSHPYGILCVNRILWLFVVIKLKGKLLNFHLIYVGSWGQSIHFQFCFRWWLFVKKKEKQTFFTSLIICLSSICLLFDVLLLEGGGKPFLSLLSSEFYLFLFFFVIVTVAK